MRTYAWRRGLWVLAVLLNIFHLGLWLFQLAQLSQEDLGMGPEAWRAALTQYAVRVGVPVISLVALLWPPTAPTGRQTTEAG